MDILNKLQNIDRRILYVLLAVVIITPLLFRPGKHPEVVLPEVHNAFEVLSNVPKDKIVIISTVWGPGTIAENRPQTEAVMRHLFTNGTKFIVISWDIEGNVWTQTLGDDLAREYNKQHGIDWVHIGYRPPPIYVVARGLAVDFQKTLSQDRNGVSLAKIPMTQNVKSQKDIGAVVEITPSGTVGSWIAYLTEPYGIPLVFCPTAVMSVEAYPYLDSGQIDGMLNGVIGAAQYEVLLGLGDKKTDASATTWALSIAHVLIILLIILGNVGYALTRRRAVGNGGRGRVR